MNAYKGTFTANTATGNQAVTGVGFTPKALLVWTTSQTATGYTDGYNFQIGMTDGTRMMSWQVISDDNTSPNDTNRFYTTARIIGTQTVAAANTRLATIVSLDSDGFTINWSTVDANAIGIHFVCLGGSDLSAATASIDSPLDVTDVSAIVTFPVICWIAAMAVSSGDAANGPCFGFAAVSPTGSITQGDACAQVRDGQTTSITGRYQRTVNQTVVMSSTAQSVSEEWRYSNIGPFKTSNANVAATIFANSIFLGACAAKAGNGLQPTASGTQAITGLGFRPKIVFLVTVGQTAQTTVQTEARFSLGAYDGTNQGYAWTGAANGVNPSVTAKGHSTTKAIVSATPNATGSSTTTDAEASVQSLDADGFTLNWSTADATQRQYLWLALGNGPALASPASSVFA